MMLKRMIYEDVYGEVPIDYELYELGDDGLLRKIGSYVQDEEEE